MVKDLLKSLGNQYASVLSECDDKPVFLDSGSYMFNALLSGSIYGGIPDNRVIALAGPEATGKTYLAVGLAGKFLSLNPKAVVFYFESEHAVDEDMTAKRGLDNKRIAKIPIATVEEFRTQCLRLLDNYLAIAAEDRGPLMIILDSLGMLSTNKEIDVATKGDDTRDMTRTQLIKAAFRIITLKAGRARVPMIVLNHTYEQIGANTKPGMKSYEMSGGGGIKYAASTIVYLTKKKIWNDESKETDGNFIHCKNVKSRLTVPERTVDVQLMYNGGIQPYYGLCDLAEPYNIWKRVANKFETEHGKFYEKQIYADPDRFFTPEVLQKFDAAAQQEYLYGNAKPGDELPITAEALEVAEEEILAPSKKKSKKDKE